MIRGGRKNWSTRVISKKRFKIKSPITNPAPLFEKFRVRVEEFVQMRCIRSDPSNGNTTIYVVICRVRINYGETWNAIEKFVATIAIPTWPSFNFGFDFLPILFYLFFFARIKYFLCVISWLRISSNIKMIAYERSVIVRREGKAGINFKIPSPRVIRLN